MNKFIFVLLGFLVFTGLFTGTTSAATCGNTSLNHGSYDVFDGVSTTTIPAVNNVNCSNGNPMEVYQPWGLIGLQTPTVKSGATFTDEAGNSDLCPAWYPSGCFDLTRTDYYRNEMKITTQSLNKIGQLNQFPQLSYWLR